tara:strand:+ start:2207 stop:2377 length:171 start_codon:yes stop_codon:yes gene_type:complete
MVKMTKDNKEYDIAEARVEKLLKRGFSLVKEDTPEAEDVESDQDDQDDQEIERGDV